MSSFIGSEMSIQRILVGEFTFETGCISRNVSSKMKYSIRQAN